MEMAMGVSFLAPGLNGHGHGLGIGRKELRNTWGPLSFFFSGELIFP
jgi:hypothetical protein